QTVVSSRHSVILVSSHADRTDPREKRRKEEEESAVRSRAETLGRSPPSSCPPRRRHEPLRPLPRARALLPVAPGQVICSGAMA
uniref:Uncharacterized protein n=1 Tax=Aegilops tauschii subsp. strangulata TaxID=200361 RepID=A0A453FWU0_AEGTS